MPNSLLRNNGDLTFTDVTFEAGLAAVDYPTQTAGWADYDNDGDLDLFVGNESSVAQISPSQLFRNNGNGTFTDVADNAGVRNFRRAKASRGAITMATALRTSTYRTWTATTGFTATTATARSPTWRPKSGL